MASALGAVESVDDDGAAGALGAVEAGVLEDFD